MELVLNPIYQFTWSVNLSVTGLGKGVLCSRELSAVGRTVAADSEWRFSSGPARADWARERGRPGRSGFDRGLWKLLSTLTPDGQWLRTISKYSRDEMKRPLNSSRCPSIHLSGRPCESTPRKLRGCRLHTIPLLSLTLQLSAHQEWEGPAGGGSTG